uniref:Craniofacial development protein 2-like n=1 Tax=Nicotiana tabacum TaxID=4097 RepID=A0A1S3XMG4_TOBAC|nr:PREDICTED: craniofacial development protein 2-like [Nicotiana tabacum]
MVFWEGGGQEQGRNRVGILVDKDLRELVVEVRRVNDRLITIKLVVGGFTLNIISVYASQAGLDEEVKRHFWKDLDEMVRGIPHTEKLCIREDFNGHIGATSGGYDDVHGGFGFGDTNGGGTSLLDFARAFNLVIANSNFLKMREHLVTFRSSVAETQINYLLCRKSDRGLCTDCKGREVEDGWWTTGLRLIGEGSNGSCCTEKTETWKKFCLGRRFRKVDKEEDIDAEKKEEEDSDAEKKEEEDLA